ncbi:MAG: hypothetical protein ACYTG6_14960 [Planctomycetota bacterium]|jgi:hypothetical protein
MAHVRRPFLFLVPTMLVAFLAAGMTPPADAGVELETAHGDLDTFNKQLKTKRSTNDDLLASIQAVVTHYREIQPPEKPELQPIPDDASDEEKAQIEKENNKLLTDWEDDVSKFEREAEKFRAAVEKALLKALKLEKIDRQTEANIRMDVNIQAARALAELGDLRTPEANAKISKDIRNVLERTIFKAKYEVPMLLLEEVFAALGRLNDHDSLQWMVDEFIHTKSSPREAVDQLVAAHKAMSLFKDVPGSLRYAVVKEMVTIYASTESTAEQSSNDPKVQAVKVFWDRIKSGAIRAVQYYAGEPVSDETGQALATMAEFQQWFRDHKNPRRAPWRDEA